MRFFGCGKRSKTALDIIAENHLRSIATPKKKAKRR